MRTTVFDVKVHVYGRVHLFFLSLGYQIMVTSFLVITGICLRFGTIFEVKECAEARMIPLKLHNFGEFTVVSFHMLINIDRLFLAFRPRRSLGKGSKVFFYASVFVAFSLGIAYEELAHYEDIRKSIAFGTICLINVLNLLLELKLYYYTNVVLINTIGVVPLERRFELSSSVTMIKCFLPASISSLLLKSGAFLFFSSSYLLKDPSDIPPFYFVLNVRIDEHFAVLHKAPRMP
ncbi:unnamed protein product [Caenorhabditis sp. 36 PRJEB53466]|nr:unnamed protein product [Caenorhabditis sp. 36 PRJEB53466]